MSRDLELIHKGMRVWPRGSHMWEVCAAKLRANGVEPPEDDAEIGAMPDDEIQERKDRVIDAMRRGGWAG